MCKKIVIGGCRNYNNYKEAKDFIDYCISNIKNEYELIFLSGNCRGADSLGERYAKENGYRVISFPANWKEYGRAAGPIRNKLMVENADYVIAFWDGKSSGTKSLIENSKKMKKPIKIKII